MVKKILYTIVCCACCSVGLGQSELWHGIERKVQYEPGTSVLMKLPGFQSVNGKRRFNRALYGTNTAFRVEAGDLPEFALYLPGMGGNFKLGIKSAKGNKWLTKAKNIIATYVPGVMEYQVYDSLMEKTILLIRVFACAGKEGMLVNLWFMDSLPQPTQLVWAFGGVTGKKFSRDGDIGADPESSFDLQPAYCADNVFTIDKNSFQLAYGSERKKITGTVPPNSSLKIVDAAQQESPASLLGSNASATPAIAGEVVISPRTVYTFLIQPGAAAPASEDEMAEQFTKAMNAVDTIHNRVQVHLPDHHFSNFGGALNAAADAIWEHPSYLHGAVAWRMRLPAWRGAYAADVLGWHDRARTHFSSYALSQVTSPETAPVVMDTALHLARHLEKIGTGMFTSGYICRNPNGDIRPHHYDMNLVFIDQLMNHFNWTGDTNYVKEMWPLIQRHLAWEKRNFDTDDDGLYDAYCCIWASDALQYSGGGVTHSSAYNYRAFTTAAELATLIGKDGSAYKKEAEKIFNAINKNLWIPQLGWYAEYKDLLGKKLVHTIPGLWTIYHALDAKLPDPFQAYQATRYVDTEIPHIPVKAEGLEYENLYVLPTSNWQPYTWSVNNVALAENLHTALAYWQANRPEEAYRLWKSALIESMYLGASPGGFQQLSFYDAIRGQLYRDFADPVGMAARSLVEGVFGIQPNALRDTLMIKPGFPAAWKQASLQTPDIAFTYSANEQQDGFVVYNKMPKRLQLKIQFRARKTVIQSVLVNKKKVQWSVIENSVGFPSLQIEAGKESKYDIVIKWKGIQPAIVAYDSVYAVGDSILLPSGNAALLSVYDPQKVLGGIKITGNKLQAAIEKVSGNKTVFVQLKQGDLSWWQPLNFKVRNAIEIQTIGNRVIINNNSQDSTGQIFVNDYTQKIKLSSWNSLVIQPSSLHPGTNKVSFKSAGHVATGEILNWEVNASPQTKFEKIDLSSFYNEKVTNIFQQNYLSPRPVSPTLQLPTQGIGNWCYPLTTANISDSGLRQQAGIKNEIVLPQGIPFSTPGDSNKNNIIFTSQWDNFPDSVTIPLTGKAAHAYMLMSGTTNPMQSQLVNGDVRIYYRDGSTDILLLKNPVNWWSIEQDYLNDGFAFSTHGNVPLRYHLKTGQTYTSFDKYVTIRGFSNRGIDGGAATVLDIPLNAAKELRSIVIHTVANDVVIGLMSLTLVR